MAAAVVALVCLALWCAACQVADAGMGSAQLNKRCTPDTFKLECAPPLFCNPDGRCAMPFSLKEGQACWREYECGRNQYCLRNTSSMLWGVCKDRIRPGEICIPSLGLVHRQCLDGFFCSPPTARCRELWSIPEDGQAEHQLECRPWLRWDSPSRTCVTTDPMHDCDCGGKHIPDMNELPLGYLWHEQYNTINRWFAGDAWGEQGARFCDKCNGACVNPISENCFGHYKIWATYSGQDEHKMATLKYRFENCAGSEGLFGEVWYHMSLDPWDISFLVLWVLAFLSTSVIGIAWWKRRSARIKYMRMISVRMGL